MTHRWHGYDQIVCVDRHGVSVMPRFLDRGKAGPQGDLRQAIGQLNSIEGAKPAGLAQWMERAEARLKLEAAEVDVSAAVMRMIAAKG